MELKELQTRKNCSQGQQIRVRNWNNQLTDFYITVLGVDSDEWIKAKRDMEIRVLMKQEPDLPALLAAVTVGWEGLTRDGKAVKFSQKAAADLYREAPYIMDQVDVFVAARENFMKP